MKSRRQTSFAARMISRSSGRRERHAARRRGFIWSSAFFIASFPSSRLALDREMPRRFRGPARQRRFRRTDLCTRGTFLTFEREKKVQRFNVARHRFFSEPLIRPFPNRHLSMISVLREIDPFFQSVPRHGQNVAHPFRVALSGFRFSPAGIGSIAAADHSRPRNRFSASAWRVPFSASSILARRLQRLVPIITLLRVTIKKFLQARFLTNGCLGLACAAGFWPRRRRGRVRSSRGQTLSR